MKTTYYSQNLSRLIDKGALSVRGKTLVVCGGVYDDRTLSELGFTDYLITSLPKKNKDIKNYCSANAEDLPFQSGSFDNVIVHAGLHHCSSPHRALCEMYRVASKNVIVFEAQDSWLVRLLVIGGYALDYEFDAVEDNLKDGGVNNSSIPNYVYRWTRRELEKTIRTFDPTLRPSIDFSARFIFHTCFMEEGRFLSKKVSLAKEPALLVFRALTKILNIGFANQGNSFCALINKDNKDLGRLNDWLAVERGRYVYRQKKAREVR